MCFQGFAHFAACRCTTLYDRECKLAEAQPFYIKILCPAYRSARQTLESSCGIGKFYCGKTADGQLLDQAYRSRREARNRLQHLNPEMVRIKDSAKSFAQVAIQAGLSQEEAKKENNYHTIQQAGYEIQQKIRQAREQYDAAARTIKAATDSFETRAAYIHNGGDSLMPALILPQTAQHGLVGELAEPASQGYYVELPEPMGSTLEMNDIRQGNQSDQWHPQPSPEGDNIDVAMRLPSSVGVWPMRGKIMVGSPRYLQEIRARNTGTRRPAKKGRGMSKDIVQQQNLEQEQTPEDSPSVRRSTRVRGKKVNYAESQRSSIASRDTSPAKTNSSMPSDRDWEQSPRKTRPCGKPAELTKELSELSGSRQNAISLSNMIADWNGRMEMSRSDPTPSTIGGIKEDTVVYTGHVQHSLCQSPPSEQSDNPQMSADLASAIMAALNEPITVGFTTPGSQGGGQRNDSLFDWNGPRPIQPNAHDGTVQYFDYDRLRRSFGTVPELTPPSAPATATVGSMDSRKRPLSASSPLLPSFKRARLSLPGDEIPSKIGPSLPYAQTGITSSRSRMPSQLLSNNELESTATTTQAMVPTAVMYTRPKVFEFAVDRDVNAEGGNAGALPDGCAHDTVEEEVGWALFNEELMRSTQGQAILANSQPEGD